MSLFAQEMCDLRRRVRWNRHLSSAAARRHAECASSGTIRRFTLARHAKETLANPLTKELSGGRVRRNVFFVAAVAGAPGLWMEAREAIREGDILNAVGKASVAFEAMFDTTIQYFISPGVSGKAEVVAVICPLVSEQLCESEQTLEAAAIDVENATELLGLATAVAFGQWRDDESVTLTKTHQVIVQSKKDIPLFLDGERVKVGKEAEIGFAPHAVNVIVPKNPIA
jgi:hypothetical protein